MDRPNEEQASHAKFPSSEEQALATFNHAGEEIRFFKGQQWHATNYALLAYAALAAAPEWMETWKASASLYCASAVIFTFLVACVVLVTLEVALNKERRRMDEVRPKLPLIEDLHKKSPGGFRWVAIPVLLIAVFGGAVLAIFINLARIPQIVACLTAGAV
jgi:hypothetical protein